MEHKYKILYKTDKGLMAHASNRIVFVNRKRAKNCYEGVAFYDENTLKDKGTYGFANFYNVKTIIPKDYGDIEGFANTGVPIKVELGHFGKSVFIKEKYVNGREVIKSFLKTGELAIQEYAVKGNRYQANPFFTRLNNVIEDWKDITEGVVNRTINSLVKKECSISFEDDTVLEALKGKRIRYAYQLENGAILIDGKYETLALWEVDGVVSMSWLGSKFDYDKYNGKEITEELLRYIM